ncbi:PHP domain-containing protein [Caloramator proteoclasticus]|uniref:Polymerase/histidinol phosphatase N-terminal domain-containing protein n=1 Tax=Caloramator proteoclasticus DSM 10124 TaxID=1121262 RepID=A0A1M4XT21_9CLOT|nr:PHP domain-containing protein [Caloramator proteoclasticus]SHE96639.1 hypothetical protein SAMN02746091_01489 [Caloramator proteoclasticus DSM 10124]
MKLYYDFHIHTGLSPCADDDMTPNNIVNMAKIKELDVIAITDHNSCKNVEACLKVAEKVGMLVIPGMELQTKEEVHVLCLFKDLDSALCFQEFVYNRLPNIKNKPDIFGNQIIFNENDEIVGYEEKLLLNSADITIDEAFYRVKELGGQFIPAHIDKDTYSIISNLGFIPDYLDIKTLEYSSYEKINKLINSKLLKNTYILIKNSDAHNLGQISERENYIECHPGEL